MKTAKALLFFIFGIFLISTVSAINVYGEWLDESQYAEIEFGDSIQFEVDFFSMNPPIENANVILYDNSLDKVYTFISDQTLNQNICENGWCYSNYVYTFTIDQSKYQTSGNFEIIISGEDESQAQNYSLYLKVNPVEEPEPENNPPEITSTAVIEVDEGETYNYQVTATDADDDTLTFSLTESPSWLSINSETGLITGTAPEVDDDTDYQITVSVSDDEDSDTQSYTLTVNDVEEDEDEDEEEEEDEDEEEKEKKISDDSYEKAYLEQFEAKTIYLQAEPEEEELSFLQKIVRAIINFFKKLFGLK